MIVKDFQSSAALKYLMTGDITWKRSTEAFQLVLLYDTLPCFPYISPCILTHFHIKLTFCAPLAHEENRALERQNCLISPRDLKSNIMKTDGLLSAAKWALPVS